MNRIIISEENNPLYNLALERELLHQAEKNCTILFLWVNNPCVIIGKNQNFLMECNLEYIKNKKIKIVRRDSGGGAVYQDLGNLNYTFINKFGEKDKNKQKKLLLKTLKELKIKAEFSGRNDLLINNKKISGQAEYSEDDNEYLHGTLMIDVNLENLENSLKVSKIKLKSKGICSVKSRVTNISEYNKKINISKIKEIMINNFKRIFGICEPIEFINKKNKNIKIINQNKELLIKDNPKYKIQEEVPYKDGILKLWFQIDKGKIKDIECSSDNLENIKISDLKSVFFGQKFSKKTIKKIIQNINGGN